MPTALKEKVQGLVGAEVFTQARDRYSHYHSASVVHATLNPILATAQAMIEQYQKSELTEIPQVLLGLYLLVSEEKDEIKKQQYLSLLKYALDELIFHDPFRRDSHLTDFRQLVSALK